MTSSKDKLISAAPSCPKCSEVLRGDIHDDDEKNKGMVWNCPKCFHHWPVVAAEQCETPKPVHRFGVSFISEVPAGAKLMAFNDQIFLVAPGMAPCFVTPTGLVPVQSADGSKVPL